MAKNVRLPCNVPIQTSISYLGIVVHSSLQAIPDANFVQTLARVEQDLQRWNSMPLSLHARIVSVKINVLPRINFLSSMIPLPASKKYWHKLLESGIIRKLCSVQKIMGV